MFHSAFWWHVCRQFRSLWFSFLYLFFCYFLAYVNFLLYLCTRKGLYQPSLTDSPKHFSASNADDKPALEVKIPEELPSLKERT